MSTTPEAAKNKLFAEATLSGESSQEITLARIVAKYRPTKTKAEKGRHNDQYNHTKTKRIAT